MVSQDRLESLCPSALLLWVVCVHLRTYLHVLVGTAEDLLQ